MGRTGATISEWVRYYERWDRARARHPDPVQTQLRRGRLRARLFNIGATVVLLGLTAASTALAVSLLDGANLPSGIP